MIEKRSPIWTELFGLQVQFARDNFEQKIPIKKVFAKNEMIDCIGVTKGKGFKGGIAISHSWF